jgi:hypothetical protein
LNWWQKILSPKFRGLLSGVWPFTLGAVVVCFLVALEIAVFGFVPSVSDPDQLLSICWSLLLLAWILMLFTFVCGFADDLQRRTSGVNIVVHAQS